MTEIKGLDQLLKQFDNLKNLDEQIIMLAGAYKLQQYSMENSPVKTGFLRQSHYSEPIEGGARMVIGANYSFYVEYGTPKWKGIPFLRPALDEHTQDILEVIKNEIEKQIKGNL
jgi:HK97 gp10 family phage protein